MHPKLLKRTNRKNTPDPTGGAHKSRDSPTADNTLPPQNKQVTTITSPWQDGERQGSSSWIHSLHENNNTPSNNVTFRISNSGHYFSHHATQVLCLTGRGWEGTQHVQPHLGHLLTQPNRSFTSTTGNRHIPNSRVHLAQRSNRRCLAHLRRSEKTPRDRGEVHPTNISTIG